jgi:hypothetical protein
MIGVFTPLGTLMELRRRLWLAAALLGAFWLVVSGCYSWARQPGPPSQVVERYPGKSLRVTRSGGASIEVNGPRIIGDSLLGYSGASRAPVAIPLSDIMTVEMLRTSAGRTALLVAAVGATVILVANAASSDNGGGYAPSAGPPPPSSGGTGGGGWGLGSCPLVYSWDGQAWRLDSGTFSGAVAQGLARTDVDNLDYAVAEGGVLRLRLANEMDETDYVDAVTVTAVDHPAGLAVLPDGQGRLHTVAVAAEPLAVTDDRGRDQRARVRASDGWHWESALVPRDSTDPRALRDGLELTFARPANATHAHLVFEAVNTPWAAAMMHRFVESHGSATQGWYDSLAASPLYAGLTRQRLEEEASLFISLWDGRRWVPQGAIWSVGQESPKRHAQELDLSLVAGDTVRVRLESVPSFWLVDYVGLDLSADAPLAIAELTLASATDSTGADRRSALMAADGNALRLDAGEHLDLTLTAPSPGPGLARSYILRSTGWYELQTRTTSEPDVTLLRRVAMERGAIARLSVGMMNDVLMLARQ